MITPLRLFLLLFSIIGIVRTGAAQTIPLPIKGQSARVPVHLQQKQQVLLLCELQPGRTYEVRLVPDLSESEVARLSFGKQAPAEVVRFRADQTCVNLTTHASGDFRGRLSAFCADCEPTAVEKMMGITTTVNSNASFLIQDVFIGGGCFDIAGVSSRGLSHQLGTFDNGGSSIDIESGIILSTGDVASATGPNNLSSTSGSGGGGGDPDLADLTTGTINDVVSLEFDFTPTINQISFQYVFASEEYCEFVNSSFNDVFGFFISGPGINGPYTNGAENIALLPGTATPVSINNVNGGSNPAYYLNNLNPGQHACNGDPPVAYSLIEYDGFTTVLTAVANVMPCQTYHIKLVLADVGDGAYDSAVFLKSNSFNPGNYATGDATVTGVGSADDTAYEGCGDVSITFSRTSDDLSEDYIVSYFISPASTATMGVDFSVLPNPIIIPAGQQSVTINLGVIPDNIPEGVEVVIIELEEPCSCTTGSIEVYIEDPPPLQLVTPPIVACEGQPVTITPDVVGGTPGYTYVWGNGSSAPSITVTPPLGITQYPVTVTDECGQSAATVIEVIADAPSALLSGEGAICQGNFQTFLQVEFTGLGPWTLTYSVDGAQQTITDIFFSPLNLPADLPGNYELISVTSNGCPGDVSGTAFVSVEEVLLEPQVFDVSCHGESDGAIQLNVTGGEGPYYVDWPNPLPDDTDEVTGLSPGYYVVTVTDANGCQGTEGIALSEPTELTVDLLSVQNFDCTNPGGGSIETVADGGTGNYEFAWNNGDNSANLDSLSPGTYSLTVTDAEGCTAELTTTVEDNVEAPAAAIEAPDLLTCAQTSLTLDGQNSSSGPDISYQWTTPDGNILSGADLPTPEIDAPGDYLLIVTDNGNACSDTALVTVLEDIEPPIAAVATPDTLTCTVGSLPLQADSSSTGPDFTYLWSTTDGNLPSGESTLQPTVDAPGAYQLLVTDLGNGCTATEQVVVTENVTPPVLNLPAPAELTCTQTSVSLDATGSDSGPAFQYTWTTTGGNLTGPDDSLITTADTPGDYYLTILNTGNGCSSTDSLTVAQDITAPTAEAGPSSELDCASSSAALDGAGSSSGAGYDYLWSTTNGNIADGGDGLSPVVSQPGLYFLTVTDTDNGCTAVDSVQIFENSNAPTALASVSGILTCDVTTLTINAAGSDSGSDYQISWSSQEGHAFDDSAPLQPTVDQPGAYVMTITNLTNSCVSTATVLVQQDIAAPTAEAGDGLELNCYLPAANLDGTASSQGDPFTYQWTTSNGTLTGDPTTADPLITTGGTYVLTILNTENGCVATDSVLIQEDKTAPVADAGTDTSLDCDTPVFTLQGQGSSTGPAFTYEWVTDNGLALPGELNPTVNQPGNYQLIVTDTLNGCSSQDAVAVTADFAIPMADAGPTATLNCDQPQLNLDGSASSQGPDFTYSWTTTDGNILSGADSPSPMVDAAGTYQLIVLNAANACADTAVVTLTEDFTAPAADAGPPQLVTCNQPVVTLGGFSDSGPNITFEWSTNDGDLDGNNAQPDPDVNTGGVYVLTVTNTENGCTATDQVTIDEDQALPVANAGPDQLLNCAQPTATLVTTGSSQGPGFNLQWATLAAAPAPTGLDPEVSQADTYVLSILNTDNGCANTDTVTVAANFDPPVADAGPTATLNCDQPQLNLDGSTSSQGPDFTYSWTTTDGNILSGADSPSPMVDAAGAYQLIVLNAANACADTAVVTLTEDFTAPAADAGPPQLVTCDQPVVTLGGFSDSGPDITYEWSTNDGDLDGNNAQPDPGVSTGGTYVLTVTNTGNGCTSTDQVTIDEDQALPMANAGPDQLLNCAQPTATLVTTGSSQGSAFNLQWATLATAPAPTGLDPEVSQADTYVLSILNTDNGCANTDTVTVAANFDPPVADAGADGTLNCDQPVLTLDASASTQGAEIAYQWTTADGNILQDADGLSPLVDAGGAYQLIVTNTTNHCRDTATVAIAENFNVPVAVVEPPVVLTCELPVVTLDGGNSSSSPTIVYQWTTPDGNITGGTGTAGATVDAAGVYTLEVTDTGNGCSAEVTAEVLSEQDLPLASAGPSLVLTCSEQSLTLDGSASESGPDITYSWSTEDGLLLSGATTPTPTVGGAGAYELTVLNTVTGCQSVATVSVSVDTLAPQAAIADPPLLTCTAPAISLDGAGSSNEGDFTYNWQGPGIQSGGNTLAPTVDQPGAYTLIVTDNSNGCTAGEQVEVDIDILVPTVNTDEPAVLTCDLPSQELSAEASGNGPLSFAWTTDDGQITTGSATHSPTVNAAGDYQLVVTNESNGCVTTTTITVAIDTLAPIAEAGTAAQIDCDNSTVTLDGSGSDGGNHAYQWTTDEGDILSGETGLTPTVGEPGAYWLIVTDLNNGCQSGDLVQVAIDDAVPTVSIPAPERLTCVNEWVTLTGQADPNLEFQWLDANGNPIGLDNPQTIDVNQPGVYQLVVTDTENGCANSETTEVIQDIEPPLAEAGTDSELNCIATSLRLDGSGSSAGPDFTYQWSTDAGYIVSGATTPQPVVNREGVYFLLVTDTNNGCTASDQLTITEEIPETMEVSTQEPPCFGDLGSISVGNVTGGYGPYLYSIDGGQNFQSQGAFANLSPGLFEVVVQDANGCEIGEEVVIPVPVELQLFLEETEVITLGDSYRLNADVNIEDEEIASVRWTPNNYLTCTDCLDPMAVQPLETTIYQVTVENQNGCTVSGELLLVVQQAPVYVPSAFSPFNNDGANDRFVVYAREKSVKQVNSLQVFNRWGESVFEVYDFPPNDPYYGWDGTHRGLPLNPGVFVYWTEVELINGTKVLVKGDVTLIN